VVLAVAYGAQRGVAAIQARLHPPVPALQ
jgi:hypothetical protein